MNRKARIFVSNQLAGILEEKEHGRYAFMYDSAYLKMKTARPLSWTMPLGSGPLLCDTLFPFFDGLIPEGWLLDLTTKNWKLDPRDRMGLLLTACRDCIGTVHVLSWEESPSAVDE